MLYVDSTIKKQIFCLKKTYLDYIVKFFLCKSFKTYKMNSKKEKITWRLLYLKKVLQLYLTIKMILNKNSCNEKLRS